MLESLERIAPKQFDVLHYLYKVRGATVEQIVLGVWGITKQAAVYESTQRSAYKVLKKLVDKKLVRRASRDFQESGVYFFTPYGYEEITSYLDIDPNYRGTGFNQDEGFFDYSLATPTFSNIEHFIKQVDVFNVFQNLERKNPGVFDYRDNRYAARSYKVSAGSNAKFRPDGEIKVLDDLYEIEVDRSTERGEALANKFSGYYRYFQWLSKNKQPLPKGIIVIIPDRQKRLRNQLVNASEQLRFQSFYQAFMSGLKEYSEHVCLRVVEFRHLEKVLELMVPDMVKEFERKALSYFKSFSNDNQPIAIGEVVEYKIAVVSRGKEKYYYFLVNGEGYKSEPWSKFQKVYQMFTRENKHVNLILYYSTFYPVPPLKGVDLQQVTDIRERKFYEHTYSVDLGASEPIWYNSSREILDSPPISH